MKDADIIALYWARSEEAIAETDQKYGAYCHSIAYHILHDHPECEECVSDTWLKAWNAMPPQRPDRLRAFLGKITRNLSLRRWESRTAQKRGGGEVPLVLEELAECVPAPQRVEQAVEDRLALEIIESFLGDLPAQTRKIFLRRHWYLASVKEIAADFGIGESKVKMTLLRTREKLKEALEKVGVTL